jgi:outer membrane protein TolC
VKVAQSNVELANQALSDATMRFTAGVDDNLPVVRAQSALVGAQTDLIQATFEYNYAKLTLARNTGVVETQYKQYLGK